MASTTETNSDPGRRWRRLVRAGAVLGILATVVPYGTNSDFYLWGRLLSILRATPGREGLLVLIFCCFIFLALLIGPILLLCASPRYTQPDGIGRIVRLLFVLLWGLAAFPPYYAAVDYFIQIGLTETGVIVVASGLSVFLLICALALLTTRRVWRTPLYPFAMGVIPVSLNSLAWGALCVDFTPSRPHAWQPIMVFGCGFVGSGSMLLGWLKWWSAVRAAERANPAASAP